MYGVLNISSIHFTWMVSQLIKILKENGRYVVNHHYINPVQGPKINYYFFFNI